MFVEIERASTRQSSTLNTIPDTPNFRGRVHSGSRLNMVVPGIVAVFAIMPRLVAVRAARLDVHLG